VNFAGGVVEVCSLNGLYFDPMVSFITINCISIR
jgi:hypothetical protein